jgi:AraC-like DNA-binding protein
MTDSIAELRTLVLRHASVPRAVLPGVSLWASDGACPSAPGIYEPMLYFTLQGTKRLLSGERSLEFGEGSFVLASLDVPVIWSVIGATRERPYLAASLKLDAVVLDLPAAAEPADESEALVVSPVTETMRDALLRLLRLFDAPADAPLLAPMIERELLYRVLQGPRGHVLRQIARSDSRLSQIQRAVKWIRAHLAEPLPVETLAGIASMSVSSFHRHFKATMGQSPLAFHKQVRLQAARLRLIAERGDVASIAFAVGYESASQFTREYTREFGLPPARDAARLRAGEGNQRQ